MLPFPWDEGALHLFHMGGRALLFDVASSSLFALDPLGAALIEEGRSRTVEESLAVVWGRFGNEAEQALDQLDFFYRAGKLLGPDPAAGLRPPAMPYLKALCLNLAHDCNLRCGYCFAGAGSFQGKRGLMSKDVAQAAIEMLLRDSGPLDRLEVDFFGGEPLLNFQVLQETVSYGKRRAAATGKRIRFTLTTNALLLDEEVSDFLRREGMRTVLSIDGRPQDHDLLRSFPDGRGSQALVLERISRFLDHRPQPLYYLRGTFTALTSDFYTNTLYLADLGYQDISMEPVVASPMAPYAFLPSHLPELSRQYERLVEEIARREELGAPLHFFHFEVDTTGLSCLSKRLSGCGAGVEYLAVTPQGTLYPCHQFIGREEFVLGAVDGGITRRETQDVFRHLSFLEKESCRACWARILCSGGCHANAHLQTGDLHKPDRLGCALTRKRMECALYLKLHRKERKARLDGSSH